MTRKRKPILLLHGGGGPRTVAPLVAALAAWGEVRAPIHPGFAGTPRDEGLTSIPALARHHLSLLDAAGLGDVILIGSSLGGWLAAEMALMAPGRFAGMVLVDAVGIKVAGCAPEDPASLPPAELMRRLWHDPARMTAGLPPPGPEALAEQAANFRALTAYDNGLTLQDPALAPRLADLRLPTLLIWGQSDGLAPPDYGRAFAAAISGARFTGIQGAGHLPHLEAPEAFLSLAEGFLESLA